MVEISEGSRPMYMLGQIFIWIGIRIAPKVERKMTNENPVS